MAAQPDSYRRRAELLARLAAERGNLFLHLEGVADDRLDRSVVFDTWTPKSLLAHVGYWDAVYASRLSKVAEGRLDEIVPLGEGADSLDARNADSHVRFERASVAEAVAIAQKERREFLNVLGRVGDDILYRRVQLRPDWRVRPYTWVRWRHQHDAEHAADFGRWRQGLPAEECAPGVIHRALLRPLLGLSRQEMLTLGALIPADDRETRPIAGGWSLKQTLGHIVDYERLGVVALKAAAHNREPDYDESLADYEAFNEARGRAWGAVPWDEVWTHLVATRRALLHVMEGMSDEALRRPLLTPWLETSTACGYLLFVAQHEREHADDLRGALGLRPLPRRIIRVA